MARQNRYRKLERTMTRLLIADAVLFLLYLTAAGMGVLWLQIVAAIFTILIGICALGLLYMSRELLKQRSLWLTTGFFGLLLCTIVSIILAFP